MILVGDNPASQVYVKNKEKKAAEVGIKSTVIRLSKNVSENNLLKVIDEAIQMHGGMGISQDTPLAHMWTHVRTLRLADGPDAVHRRQVARAELRRYSN